MNVSNINQLVLSVKKILKCFAHAVARATDEVVGDMSEANFYVNFISKNEKKGKICYNFNYCVQI